MGNIQGWTPSPWHPQHFSSPILHHHPFFLYQHHHQVAFFRGRYASHGWALLDQPSWEWCPVILHSLGVGIICLFKKHFKEVVASRYTSSSNYCLAFTASLPSLQRPSWRKMTQMLSFHKVEVQEFSGTHCKYLRFCNSHFLLKVLNLLQSMLPSFQKGTFR